MDRGITGFGIDAFEEVSSISIGFRLSAFDGIGCDSLF
jgi:hypothetical protein